MFGQEGFYCFVGSLVLGSSKTAVLSSWDCNQFPVDAHLFQRFLEANLAATWNCWIGVALNRNYRRQTAANVSVRSLLAHLKMSSNADDVALVILESCWRT